MLRKNASEITIATWDELVRANVETLSAPYRPTSAPLAFSYDCDAATFIAGETYLVRFTDRTGSRLVPYNDPTATPITLQNFVKNADFVDSVLTDWYKESLGAIDEVDIIVMHCSGCDRRVVIDGVHRITWIALNRLLTAKIKITELSGFSWPRDMPDMSVICACGGG